MDIYQKAYDWAKTHNFEPIEIEYASKLALKMLDDSCQMSSEDRKMFFMFTMQSQIEKISLLMMI